MRGTAHGQCLTEDTLTEYLEGSLDPGLKAASEVHLIACDDCRNRLGFFMRMLDADVGIEENQNLQAINAEWDRRKHGPRLARTGTFPPWLLGLVGIAAALMIGVVSARLFLQRPSEPKSAGEVVALLLSRQRPFEARMADEPHLPIVRTRGMDDAGVSYPLLAGQMTRFSANAHEMGRFYLLQNDFPTAIQYLEIAGREVGASAAVHNDLGVAYLESGDPPKVDKSSGEFQEALRIDPSFVSAVFNLALFYERANEPEEAAAQLKRYLELDPESEWTSEARGRLQGLSR